MSLTIEQPIIAAALKRAAQQAPNKSPILVLTHVKLVAADVLTITASDLDRELTQTVAATVQEPFSLCIPAAAAANVVAKLAKGSLVTIQADGTISAGKSRFKLPTMPPEDFPKMASDQYETTVNVPADVMHGLLRVDYAASTEETRYYLRGVYLHGVDGVAASVATDGHQLAVWRSDMAYDGPNVIIPSETVKAVAGQEGDITLSVSETKVRFEGRDWALVSKVIDGTYPDYTRVVPNKWDVTVTADARAMRDVIDRVSVAVDKGNALSLRFGGDALTVTGGANGTSASDECDVSGGGDIEIGMNAKYITAALAQVSGEVVLGMSLGAPVLMRTPLDEGLTLISMPMRL